MVDVVIVALILVYCAWLIVKRIKSSKEPNCSGGCACCGGSCGVSKKTKGPEHK